MLHMAKVGVFYVRKFKLQSNTKRHRLSTALTIHSLNSKGQSARIAGIKSGRQHENINKTELRKLAGISTNVIAKCQ